MHTIGCRAHGRPDHVSHLVLKSFLDFLVVAPGLPQGWTNPCPRGVRDNLNIYDWVSRSDGNEAGLHISLHIPSTWYKSLLRQAGHYKVVSLFSGCLGLELGLKSSGS